MSIIFGVLKNEGDMMTCRELQRLAVATAPYALDGLFSRVCGRIGMGFQPFHTHQRSGNESTPVMSADGNIALFDGRLDNCDELSIQLGISPSGIGDSEIALTAFERWGEKCFSRFVGDWALAIWDCHRHELYLGRDHSGARTLYYEKKNEGIMFSTFLETFFAQENSRALNKTYASCYLSGQTLHDLTPYDNIYSVPAASYIVFSETGKRQVTHWSTIQATPLLYRTDSEYEEHFLNVFTTAVARRTAFGDPVVAQLSGGIDSSANVCISDRHRLQEGLSCADLINTVSYFDDTEPHWNDLEYIHEIERHRNKAGIHIDSSSVTISPGPVDKRFRLPGAGTNTVRIENDFEDAIKGCPCRVILSGLGGDELLGGIPNPLPELIDHLRSADLALFARQVLRWSLANRHSAIHLSMSAVSALLSLYLRIPSDSGVCAPWVRAAALDTTRNSFLTAVKTVRPSNLGEERRWRSLIGALPHLAPAATVRREYRYPYLDRDFVDFVMRLPREQLLRPGHRRSLMRRSLEGIVPGIVLDRRRKAYVAKKPLQWLYCDTDIMSFCKNLYLGEIGCIDIDALLKSLPQILSFRDTRWNMHLARTIGLEFWIREKFLAQHGVGQHHAPLQI
jgi:asparagine synthase (glutamine-hydrolysing)